MAVNINKGLVALLATALIATVTAFPGEEVVPQQIQQHVLQDAHQHNQPQQQSVEGHKDEPFVNVVQPIPIIPQEVQQVPGIQQEPQIDLAGPIEEQPIGNVGEGAGGPAVGVVGSEEPVKNDAGAPDGGKDSKDLDTANTFFLRFGFPGYYNYYRPYYYGGGWGSPYYGRSYGGWGGYGGYGGYGGWGYGHGWRRWGW